jgi:hypothetical protein
MTDEDGRENDDDHHDALDDCKEEEEEEEEKEVSKKDETTVDTTQTIQPLSTMTMILSMVTLFLKSHVQCLGNSRGELL